MARHLSFKAVFIGPILDGTKFQTMRKAGTGIMEGDVLDFFCRWGEPPFARVRVTDVEEVRRDDLDGDLARADGYYDAEDLRKALDEFYPSADCFDVIRWDLLGSGE